MPFPSVDQRPGLAADVVGGQQALMLVSFEQRPRRVVIGVAQPSQREPERGVDEDQRDPPP
jgi:hypothetical protein